MSLLVGLMPTTAQLGSFVSKAFQVIRDYFTERLRGSADHHRKMNLGCKALHEMNDPVDRNCIITCIPSNDGAQTRCVIEKNPIELCTSDLCTIISVSDRIVPRIHGAFTTTVLL